MKFEIVIEKKNNNNEDIIDNDIKSNKIEPEINMEIKKNNLNVMK